MRACHFEDFGPLAVGSFTHLPSDAEFEIYLADLEAVYLRRQRFALVLDCINAPDLSAPQRRRHAQWMKERDALIRSYLIGIAFVFSSPATRFVLSSVFLVKPLPAPYAVCASRQEALTWAGEQLRRSGVDAGLALAEAWARLVAGPQRRRRA